MPALSPAAADHAALFGGGCTAPVLGRIALVLEAVDFIGTPGAETTAVDRVTDAALGITGLPAAADAAPGRVSGAALIVADLVPVGELAVAEVSGAMGAAAGAVDEVTVAVIE